MGGGSLSSDLRRKVFFLSASFFFVFGFSNVSYFLPVYYEQIGLGSPKDAGWLVASFYIFSVLSRPFLAGVVSRLGFRNVFLLAGVLSVASSVGIAAAGVNFWAAFVARGVLGLASSLFQIGLGIYQAVAFNEDERGRAFSLIMSGGILPMMTLYPVADWLLHRGMSGVYILIPIVSCAGGALVTLSIPGIRTATMPTGAVPATSRNPFAGMGDCMRIPAFRLALFSMFLFSVTDAAASFMASMTAAYGLMASYFLSSNALVGVLVRLFCGRLLDRFPRWRLSTPAVMITSGMLILATIAPTERSLIGLGLAFGVGMGLGFPLHLALISDGVPPSLQPQAVSLSWFMIGLTFAVVPLAMGVLGDLTGPIAAFRIINTAALAGILFCASRWHKLYRAR